MIQNLPENTNITHFAKRIEKEIGTEMRFLRLVISLIMILVIPGVYVSAGFFSFSDNSMKNNKLIKTELNKLSNFLINLEKPSAQLLSHQNDLASEQSFVNAYYAEKRGNASPYISEYFLLNHNFSPLFESKTVDTQKISRYYLASNKNTQTQKIDFYSFNHTFYLIEKIGTGYQGLSFVFPQFDSTQLGAELLIVNAYDEYIHGTGQKFVSGSLGKVQVGNKDLTFHQGKLILSKQFSLPYGLRTIQYKTVPFFQFLLLWWLFLLAIFLYFMWRKTKSVTQKIVETASQELYLLKQQMNEIMEGSRTYLSMDSNDEFMDISERINKLLQDNSRLQQEYYEATLESLKAENKKLEAQFNPHFLFNSLETIRVTISTHPKIAEEMIKLLNEVLRYSIKGVDGMTRLGSEIQYIKNYFRMFEIRYEHFSYSIKIDSKLEDILLPKLILLPIIENSLKYGLRKRNDLKIQLIAQSLDEHTVEISVVDNGGGVSLETYQSIKQMIKNPKKATEHYGLVGVSQRLKFACPHSKLFFKTSGEEFIVAIELEKEEKNHV